MVTCLELATSDTSHMGVMFYKVNARKATIKHENFSLYSEMLIIYISNCLSITQLSHILKP
jgi:hypothetical protein